MSCNMLTKSLLLIKIFLVKTQGHLIKNITGLEILSQLFVSQLTFYQKIDDKHCHRPPLPIIWVGSVCARSGKNKLKYLRKILSFFSLLHYYYFNEVTLN